MIVARFPMNDKHTISSNSGTVPDADGFWSEGANVTAWTIFSISIIILRVLHIPPLCAAIASRILHRARQFVHEIWLDSDWRKPSKITVD
jgi:hypothetical protein